MAMEEEEDAPKAKRRPPAPFDGESSSDDDTISYVEARDIRSLEFLVRCPPEIAWHVLGYWRCQYPVDTYRIDHLGFH